MENSGYRYCFAMTHSPFMLTLRLLAITTVFLVALAPAAQAADANPHLSPFEPFLDTTWKAQVSETPTGEPVYDVARWELGLKGQAIRMFHSVGEGSYGGETIVMWDREQEKLVYSYFTTAGFFTTGEIEITATGALISREKITGNQAGFIEAESTSELLENGQMRVRTRMRQNGEWVDRGEVLYEKAPEAELVLD